MSIALLNYQEKTDLLELRDTFVQKHTSVILHPYMTLGEIENYNANVYAVQSLMQELDMIFNLFSISKHISSTDEIYAESSINYDDAHYLNKLNKKITALCEQYLTFLDDILRVKYLYNDFVTNHLHHKGKFLDDSELAKIFQKFIVQHPSGLSNSYMEFTSGYSKFFHTVMQTDSGSLLCESYTFQSIGAFLYFDLFRGISYNFIPNQCKICQSYFLVQGGRYSHYCENPSP